MFEKEQNPQVFKEEFSRENLPEEVEMEVEIYGEGNKEENKITKISKELQDAILVFLCKFEKVCGLEKGEKLSLYFEKGDLMLNFLDKNGEVTFSWLIYTDQETTETKSIEELIKESDTTKNVYEKAKKRLTIFMKRKIGELIAVEDQEDNFDLSENFLTLPLSEFNKFTEKMKREAKENQSNLSITIYWKKEYENKDIPRKLKAIRENLGPEFNRSFTIIGTKEDKESIVGTSDGANTLNSGIKFIEI